MEGFLVILIIKISSSIRIEYGKLWIRENHKENTKMDKTYLNKFYKMNHIERLNALVASGSLTSDDLLLTKGLLLTDELSDNMIENHLVNYELPLGVALNFLIDEKDYIIPMAIEEPSVIAAASAGAKIIAQSGGFKTIISERIMIGQVALKDVPDIPFAKSNLIQHKNDILKKLMMLTLLSLSEEAVQQICSFV